MTWGSWYWPGLLFGWFVLFLPAEIFALVNGWQNTLSNWVWTELGVTAHHGIFTWSALDYLVFGAWIVTATWLTGHFFFGIWR